MAGFDQRWFDELRRLSAATVRSLPHEAFVPHLHEANLANAVSNAFTQTAMDLLKGLYKTRYRFDRDFCVYEREVCVFPQGSAFRGQWNIGFSAGVSPADDGARIGLGFRLRRDISPKGFDDYTDFVQRVLADPQGFDTTFGTLGGYSEGLPAGTKLSSRVIRTDSPDPDDDWRFYGRFVPATDASVCGSVDRFVRAAVDVFDIIHAGNFF